MISRLILDLRSGAGFVRSQGLRASFAAILDRDTHPLLQFIKYGACGGISVVILSAIAVALNFTVLPAYGGDLADSVRERNMIIANCIAFPFANAVTYWLNVLWVFTPGRHSKLTEFTIFTIVAAISFGGGLLLGPKLIGWFGIPSVFAQSSLIVSSALINYVARKFIVFSR